MLEGNECYGKALIKAKEIRSAKRKSFAVLSRAVKVGLIEKAISEQELERKEGGVWHLRETIPGRGNKDSAMGTWLRIMRKQRRI